MTFVELFVKGMQQHGRRLFHFTDSRNIDNIRKAGLLPTLMAQQQGLVVATGGDEASLSIDQHKGLNRYVRLSFCRNHPMSHVAKERGNIQDSRILTVCPTTLLREGVLVADQVATANEAIISGPNELLPKMDFEATYQYLDWSVPENYSRRNAAEKWEALIPTPIAVDLIRGI